MLPLTALEVNEDLSSALMQSSPNDLGQVRLDNALALFEEFVRATARHADAATLRGLERRFAERVQIQPSYWSQIKGRTRQIGERLARQFEHLCHKPRGWMDAPHGAAAAGQPPAPAAREEAPPDEALPRDDDERFIMGLVLTYYRRHPQRARARLLDLLGEVLTPPPASPAPHAATAPGAKRGARDTFDTLDIRNTRNTGTATPLAPAAEEAHSLWLRTQAGVAPLKRKK